MSKELVNLTPHAVVLENPLGSVTFEPSGLVARIEQETTHKGQYQIFDIVSYVTIGNNLPEPEEGKRFLVSAMVLALGKELGRTDLLAPDTNRAKRNDKGHIISVPGFVA